MGDGAGEAGSLLRRVPEQAREDAPRIARRLVPTSAALRFLALDILLLSDADGGEGRLVVVESSRLEGWSASEATVSAADGPASQFWSALSVRASRRPTDQVSRPAS